MAALFASVSLSLATITLATLGVDKDVFGTALARRVPDDGPVLVIYTNKDTRQSLAKAGPELGFRLRDVTFTTVVSVDIRHGVPGLFRGMARGKVRDAWRHCLRDYRRVFEAHGVEPPPDAGARIVFVADDKARSHGAAGLRPGFREALAVVLDRDGREVARGAFPRETQHIEQALRDAAREGNIAAGARQPLQRAQ